MSSTRKKRIEFYGVFTAKQRAKYGNKCGPKFLGLYKLIPNLVFGSTCRHHDFNYDVGGNEWDRTKADFIFAKELAIASWEKGAWYSKLFHIQMAPIYFVAVRLIGFTGFEYGKPKTLKQLIKYANKKYGIKL